MPKKTGKDKADKRNKTVGKDDKIGNEKTIPIGEHSSPWVFLVKLQFSVWVFYKIVKNMDQISEFIFK